MTANVVLALGVLAAIGTLLASVRVRRPVALAFPMMMTSWLVGELAVFHLVAQLVVAAVFVVSGALGSAAGQAGVALLVFSSGALVLVQRRAGLAEQVFDRALRDGLGDDYGERIGAGLAPAIEPPPRRQAWHPFRFDHAGVEVIRGLAYGEDPVRNRLDLYRPQGSSPTDALPVVLFVHGGGWVIGNKDQQGKPMLLHLARRGYVGVTINYRLGPRNRWPAQIVDVKRAIAWVHEHIAEYGGDPAFLALAGASAGGHLVALAALTPGDPVFQPGFELADTSVSACIPIYAPFDLTDQAGLRGRAAMRRFLERLVMASKLSADQEGWRAASPLFRGSAGVPPIFVIQGSLDILVWREESRQFVEIVRGISSSPVMYAEVPGAQHAFDVFNSVRSRAAANAIARFLASLRHDRPPNAQPFADLPTGALAMTPGRSDLDADASEMLPGVPRRRGFRRHRILKVAALVVAVLGLVAFFAVRSFVAGGGDTSEIPLDEIIRRFEASTSIATSTSASTSASTSRPAVTSPAFAAAGSAPSTAATTPPVSADDPVAVFPAPGVYVYETTGGDSIDAAGGVGHDYPDTTTITVTSVDCGVLQRWDVAVERWVEWQRCADDGGVAEPVRVNHDEFFDIAETDTYACAGDARPLEAPDGTTWVRTCRKGDHDDVHSGVVVGVEQISVDGTSVQALHVRITVDNGVEEDRQTTDSWYQLGSDLLLVQSAANHTTNSTAFGVVHYAEEYEIRLTSLDHIG